MNNTCLIAVLSGCLGNSSPPVLEFLERGFSDTGELAVASVFLAAQKHRKNMKEALRVCRREWRYNWRFQQPSLRGDTYIPAVKQRNIASLERIYRALCI